MTDFHSMTLNKNYSEITEQDLIEHRYIRPHYLEYMLSYFFGETKFILEEDKCKIQLTQIPFQTHFNVTEIQTISYDEFINRFWTLSYKISDYASKKSRP